MKIYAISGLGANRHVFDTIIEFLPLEIIDWKSPFKNESIDSYARRMAANIDTSEPFCLLGVSFGGLIVVEMNKFLKPHHSFLISSAKNTNEIRPIFRLLGKTKIDKIIPEKLYKVPRWIALYFIGAYNKRLASEILAVMDTHFTKWAVGHLIRWKHSGETPNLTKVHGNRDLLMPLHKTAETIIIEGGKHFMIADRAREIAEIIKRFV